jgi:hypothetical protein
MPRIGSIVIIRAVREPIAITILMLMIEIEAIITLAQMSKVLIKAIKTSKFQALKTARSANQAARY